MDNQPQFKMSQDYELIPPRKTKAYPILVEEWNHLKSKINQIRDEANLWHTVGSVLLGVAGSAITGVLMLDIPPQTGSNSTPTPIVYGWAVFFVTSISGSLSLYFAKQQRKDQQTNASEVISHMNLIEKRYDNSDTLE